MAAPADEWSRELPVRFLGGHRTVCPERDSDSVPLARSPDRYRYPSCEPRPRGVRRLTTANGRRASPKRVTDGTRSWWLRSTAVTCMRRLAEEQHLGHHLRSARDAMQSCRGSEALCRPGAA